MKLQVAPGRVLNRVSDGWCTLWCGGCVVAAGPLGRVVGHALLRMRPLLLLHAGSNYLVTSQASSMLKAATSAWVCGTSCNAMPVVHAGITNLSSVSE